MKINSLKELIAHYRNNKVILWGSEWVGYFQVTDLDLIMDLKDKTRRYRYYLNKDSKTPHYLDNADFDRSCFYAIDGDLLGCGNKKGCRT